MKFHALGPLAVERQGEMIDLGPRKQRMLLALLLVNANELMSVERILEALWGENAAGKEKALRVHVSRLRSALDPDRARGDSSVLETVGAAYRLNVESDQLDVSLFESRAAEGRQLLSTDPAASSEVLTSALSLWTGNAFEDFAYEEFAQVEIARLGELRVAALEDRIDADLARGQSGELVSEIEILRDHHPLRERLVRQQALALYRSGRPADALRAIDRFRCHLGEEVGLDPSPALLRLEEQVLLHDQSIQPQPQAWEGLDRHKSRASNPFKGLRPFGSDDAASFFGRDALVAELLRSVGSGRSLISLVGASGSGKSSVIRAGLLPALAKGAVEGSDRWLVATMVPGAHPFAEFEAALLRTTLDGPNSLSEQLEDPSAGILRSVLRVLPDEGAHLVLVIDQFEELFTMTDEEVRRRFLASLVTAIDDPKARLTVVLTLRADFYEKPLQHPEFGARLGGGIINATPLTAEELAEAAVFPAREAGVEIEAALLGRLIADVGDQPGGLPLFQYALTELFARRAGDTLLLSSYRDMGGIVGAIQRRADEVYEALSDEEQDAARQLLLRLVVVGEHGERSRRRVAAREVASLGADTVTMQSTIAKLGVHRLLSFDSDRLSGAPTVEVAHEALLTAWPMLQGWIETSRDDVRRHGSLVIALREWQIADRSPHYLLPVARLAEFQNWERTSHLRLNDQERAYLDASAAKLAAEDADREAGERRAARGRRLLWSLVGVLAGALVVAALFLAGVFAPDPGPTVTFFGQRNPDRVSDSIKIGVDRAEADLDMALNDVRWTVDLRAEFEEFAQTDPKLVIPDSSVLFEPQIFHDHPDIRFGVVDPGEAGYAALPNVSFVNFRNEEGAFLAGVAAASTTTTGVVGFVGGARLQLIEEFRAGFEAGVAAVDPEVEVLATFVSTNLDNGFANPNGADARATELYERGADVVFHAAGLSGQGIFAAADRYSAANGAHVWGIGVDVDQWHDLSVAHRDHVLTSIIKRQDVAAYKLAEHLINDGPAGLVDHLGLAERGYDYVTTGDSMPAQLVDTLDRFIEEVSSGRIIVPTVPTGPILRFDGSGVQVEGFQNDEIFGPDFDEFAPIDEGVHRVSSLGVPLTVEVVGDWHVQVNMDGHTVFSYPDSERLGDRDLVFLRPTEFADPTNLGAAPDQQALWPASELNGLDGFREWLAVVEDGIISGEPRRVELAGRDAIYFEVEVSDSYSCGSYGYCAGFLINVVTTELGISGWAFERGFHQRIWVVDGGAYPPLVVVASTPSGDRSFQGDVDAFLDRITIGEPGPHPLTPPAAVNAGDLEGLWVSEATSFKIRFNSDGTYEVAVTEDGLDSSPAESGRWTVDGAEFVFDTQQSDCPGILDRPGRYRISLGEQSGDLVFAEIDDPCSFRAESLMSAPWRAQ